jgi:hypothetical protein
MSFAADSIGTIACFIAEFFLLGTVITFFVLGQYYRLWSKNQINTQVTRTE